MPVCVSVPFFFFKSLMFVIVHGRCHRIKIMTREYPFLLFFMLFLKIMLCASMMFEPHTVSAVRAIKVTLEVVVCVYCPQCQPLPY